MGLRDIFKKTNQIKLTGHGNITFQDSHDITFHSFNLDDKKYIEDFLLKLKGSTEQLTELIHKLDNIAEYRSDAQSFEKLVQEKILITKFFRLVKPVNEVTVADILDLRAKSYQEYYYQRSTDDEIYNALTTNKSILIIGNSLSGKTRAIYEALKRNKDSGYLILVPEIINDFISFPKIGNIDFLDENDRPKIVFIDDIDVFYQKENVNQFIGNILRSGAQVIATCRTGPEYDLLLNEMDAKIEENFTLVQIPKITQAVANELNTKNLEIEIDRFDGNIGSLFLPLAIMKKRYENLLSKNNEIVEKIALQILDILKALYFSANFEQKSTYSTAKVKDYYSRKIKRQGDVDSSKPELKDIANEIYNEAQENMLRNWDSALTRLSSTNTDLGFIEKQEGLLRIEEVYFERDIFSSGYSMEDITGDIFALYPNESDRLKHGFFAKLRQFNILIAKADSYHEAQKIFEKMKQESIKPDEVTFNTLIDKAPDFETALTYLDEMKKAGLKPDEVTFI